MSFLDFFLHMGILLLFLGSEITNKIGASGAILLCIYAVLKLLVYFNIFNLRF